MITSWKALTLLRDSRQGHIADIAVHHRQEYAAEDGYHRIVYPGPVQTVPLQIADDPFFRFSFYAYIFSHSSCILCLRQMYAKLRNGKPGRIYICRL